MCMEFQEFERRSYLLTSLENWWIIIKDKCDRVSVGLSVELELMKCSCVVILKLGFVDDSGDLGFDCELKEIGD